jgi:hypothetical protein
MSKSTLTDDFLRGLGRDTLFKLIRGLEMRARDYPVVEEGKSFDLKRLLMSECTCVTIMQTDETRHFRGCPMREKYPTHAAEKSDPYDAQRDALIAERDTYRDTCTNAQEAGTRLWNQLVRARNLLRVAQPHLEQDNMRNPDELELAALCNEIEKEIGSLEDNTTEEDGRLVAERLGIDIEKWAAELRAKVDAADAKEKS